MIEAIIAQECAALSESLRRTAGQAASATTLRQIATAMEAVAEGARRYQDGQVIPTSRNDDGLILKAMIAGDPGEPTAMIVTGLRGTDTRWLCSCAAAREAYAGICAHIVAVKLAIAVDAAEAHDRARALRRRQLAEATRLVRSIKGRLECAEGIAQAVRAEFEDAEARYYELLAQVNADDDAAVIEPVMITVAWPAGTPRQEAA